MRQLYENQYEQLVYQDINNLQLAMHKSFYDDTLYGLFGKSNGVIGNSFTMTYVSALAASLSSGTGFYYDSSQNGYSPLYRMILSAAAIPVTFTTANGSNPRIDLVCLAPNWSVSSTAQRNIKTGGIGPVVLTTVNKGYVDSYTLQVVAGTPASSPAVPSLPAGYIPIAQALIHTSTGMGSQADIIDLRVVLKQNLAKVFQTKTSAYPMVYSDDVVR